MIRGVIFDLDGVLVSTDELHFQSWKRVAEDEGIPFDRAINERLRGVDRITSLAIVLERATRTYSADERLELAKRKNDLFRAMVACLTPADLLPGVPTLLHGLRDAGVRMAVASSSKNATLIVDRLQLAPYFDAVIDGNHITRSKPDPEVFLTAARRLGLIPADCLVVEDAISGIEAARRAGMSVLGVGTSTEGGSPTRWAPDLATVDLPELLRINES